VNSAPARVDLLIVGGGHSGAGTAIALRDGGFAGSVAILSAEEVVPYHRPPLSKEFLRGEAEPDELAFRRVDEWDRLGVEFRLGERVTDVDPVAHRVRTDLGRSHAYGELIWAAGCAPRVLTVPGAEPGLVGTLRTLGDASALRGKIEGAVQATIIGGGFIGLEVASVLAAKGLRVTLVEALDRLLARVTSPVVSDHFARLHVRNGVEVLLGRSVREIVRGEDGRVAVLLDDRMLDPADIVLAGIGVIPNVAPLAAAGAEISETSRGVVVDASGHTTLPDVWAVGDCADSPSLFALRGRTRLESLQNATDQSRNVAVEILGAPRDARPAAPWFWSHQFDVKFRTVGLQEGHDVQIIRGDPRSDAFSVLYLHGSRFLAIDSVNTMRDYAQSRALIANGANISAVAAADPGIPLADTEVNRAGV
jgi:3-phenylpropionate/trans-cinnamate dioxygenase ferredoxin reductase subunit